MSTDTNAFLFSPDGAGAVAHALTLRELQSTVGGYVDVAFTVESPDGDHFITGYVHDEGLLIGLPPVLFYGSSFLAGPCIVVGLSRDGETIPLTQSDIEHIVERTEVGTAISRDGEIINVFRLSV